MFSKLQRGAVVALTLVGGSVATVHAAVPEAVTTALTTAGTDTTTVASAVVAIVIGILAFKWIRKALT